MAQQPKQSVENTFIGGLKTEFTGLNFPEHCATDCDNTVFGLTGNVTRRLGIDYEAHRGSEAIDRTEKAVSTFKWTNAGGDGEVQLQVLQVGATLYFYRTSDARSTIGPSDTLLFDTVSFTAYGTWLESEVEVVECQYATGNGYLFVYHPMTNPFYCIYAGGDDGDTISSSPITLKMRDFSGIKDGYEDGYRPEDLTGVHNYNIANQGWVASPALSTVASSSWDYSIGLSEDFTIPTGLAITVGDPMTVSGTFEDGDGAHSVTASGIVVSYSVAHLVLNISNLSHPGYAGNLSAFVDPWYITGSLNGNIDSFQAAVSLYPSNSDVWWRYKNADGVVDFSNYSSVTSIGVASKGHFLLDVFSQDRTTLSGALTVSASITTVSTRDRPRTGAWFQGRVWYAGTNSTFASTSTVNDFTWTESIFFSQIVTDVTQLGRCYQQNDPTNDELFDILPTDGGVIRIQGIGSIHKLVPYNNGLMVFGDNGIWFVTGSQGIGFSASDYTIVQISEVKCVSANSFINVNGTPMFWNDEDIYQVTQVQGGGFQVEPLTVGTILSFYQGIPIESRRMARAAYDPINYIVKWLYKSEDSQNTTDKYTFDRVLNYNTHSKAFYPYSFNDPQGYSKICGILYFTSPGGASLGDPGIKYIITDNVDNAYYFSMAEERDTDYVDFASSQQGPTVDYDSYFITNYKLEGGALRKWQPVYVFTYSNNEVDNSYQIQGYWDYAANGNSGRVSARQLVENTADDFSMKVNKRRIRGHGLVLQLKYTSMPSEAFDIMGWAVEETFNQTA